MAGFVYVMSNPGFDGRVKIGKSSKDPTADRVGELNNTSSVPEPFKVEYYCYVEKFDQLETKVHRLLDERRPNKRREFFKIELWDAVDTIKEVAEELGGIKFEEFFFDHETKAVALSPLDQSAVKELDDQDPVSVGAEHDTGSGQSYEDVKAEPAVFETAKPPPYEEPFGDGWRNGGFVGFWAIIGFAWGGYEGFFLSALPAYLLSSVIIGTLNFICKPFIYNNKNMD